MVFATCLSEMSSCPAYPGCSYFARDNVGLPGFAAFYRASSLEERTHAQQLMNFQVPFNTAPLLKLLYLPCILIVGERACGTCRLACA